MAEDLGAHRWASTAFTCTEKLITALREETALDEDWLDFVEESTKDLFRDLAVALGLAPRASNWEGAEEEDPLVLLRNGEPCSETKPSVIVQHLRRSADLATPDRPEKDFCIACDAEDALLRACRLLVRLSRLRQAEDDDTIHAEIDAILEPTLW